MDNFSFLNAAHTVFFADLYDQYLKDPDSVEPSWRAFFQGYDFGSNKLFQGEIVEGVTSQIPDHVQKEFNVINLIDAYRSRGHLFTSTNPVRDRRSYSPSLAIEYFDLSNDDLDTIFNAGEILGLGPQPLQIIIQHLTEIYCDSIGVEYMYIRNPRMIDWIQNKLNINNNHPKLSVDQKKQLLGKLVEAVSFENFLHTKYVGQKRFSLEGGESLIPALDILIEIAADKGVKEFVMGMSHRGRLSTLVNIFGKSAKNIFSEFEGKDYEEKIFDGDVKYHLGWTSNRETIKGKKINLNIAPNPSHLEAVGSIVNGIVRSKQDSHFPENFEKVLPIIVHGDAAIAGQGLVYELVQMSRLEGYQTNGTIHIVVNNQIGFTTNYLDGRSSTYCTDVGKVTLSPVLHVNADDVESVVHAVLFALDFRMEFKKDVFIDLLGYRKYGHNEGDEPRFTQPKLYKIIAKHPNPKKIYADKLINEGVIDEKYVNDLESNYKNWLEDELKDSKKVKKTKITDFMEDEWEDFSRVKQKEMMLPVNTIYPKIKLERIVETISTLPKGKKFINKIKRLVSSRLDMFNNDKLDWSMAEHLAYGSLLEEGFNVRISGQDVERGTFSHRHSVIKVEESEEEIILHNNISESQGTFSIYNSLLSEYGVLGFEYGYAMSNPNTLTIWEAQFGDFSNGAQIIIDQYIFSGEDKWKTPNGIVLLLPHGYEGQGAEHSSARVERYLQLCAKDNVFVANCTTPANIYHLLRRQMKTNYRKPLIIFTPKSLLRHSRVFSSVDELTKGGFQVVIDDNDADPKIIESLVFVTGKFYYDLLEEKERLGRKNMAIVRIEQLFPLPKEVIRSTIKKYSNASDIVWAQEEPRNMGAYGFLLMNLKEVRDFRIASRRNYGSTAAGSSVRFQKRHKEVIEYVFNAEKDNQILK
ncbi:MAG TPA: 2-oxoglutarate dehydrogenase E1 component [Flavobacteriaceae bacterium]|nr:2-oxoglutarate dehydrogenase E1 component [Flavobacteriaceae bacterium]|tara:strand:+ start:379 stop:3138 length:2760 start_codon:yes stop_codon:yes gene_type:complete